MSFILSQSALNELSAAAVKLACDLGASQAEVEVSESRGQSVNVRLGEVETIEYNHDKSFDVTVYVGKRRGNASSADFSQEAIQSTVKAALEIAKFTGEDDCAGLPDPENLADSASIPDLELYHPWPISIEEAINLAQSVEQHALQVTGINNSEGASWYSSQSQFSLANSLGFVGGYPSSRHSLSCSVIAGQGDDMQRDYWFSRARKADLLDSAESIGRMAAERALRRLGARSIETAVMPVIFEASLSSGILGSLLGAVSGGNLYRKTSFLLDSLGKQVLHPSIQIIERAKLLGGMASAPFDQEGVKTSDRDWIVDGVLNGYFLSSYSARKLGMTTTGHSGGAHNLWVKPTATGLDELIRSVKKGVLVTELLGHGVNMVTGDYSRGASGFYIENGEIVYPIEEFTVAGNLKSMFLNIVGVGADVIPNGSKAIGSILIEGMTIAGGALEE